MVERLISGSSMNRRISKWEDVYGSIEKYLPNSYTQVPMGDPRYGKLNAATFLGREKHSTGLAPTWTAAQAPSAMGISYEGPGEIPVVTVNGSSDEFTTPDVAYFDGGDGTTDNAMSYFTWIRTNGTPAQWDELFSKWNNSGQLRQYLFRFDDAGFGFELRFFDESANVSRGRNGPGTGLVAGQLHQIGFTYSGDQSDANAGINLYVDTAIVDDGDVDTAGGYVAMESSAAPNEISGNIGGQGRFDGEIAGGPCGPIFTQTVLTAEEIAAIYRTQAAALGVL